MTDTTAAERAGRLIWDTWRARGVIEGLPEDCRPGDLETGYRAQDALVALCGAAPLGYKIAATAKAGQAHLQIDHPIAGRLLAPNVFRGDDVTVALKGSRMALAEVEFAFVLGEDLPPRAEPYTVDEVMARVAALHLAVELPDSRIRDVAAAGAPQLIADNACADWFVLGPEVVADWRDRDLADQEIWLTVNGSPKTHGRGGDALGDPRAALTWLANHLSGRGLVLKAGEMVTTGVCGAPTPVAPGDVAVADYGDLGRLTVRLA